VGEAQRQCYPVSLGLTTRPTTTPDRKRRPAMFIESNARNSCPAQAKRAKVLRTRFPAYIGFRKCHPCHYDRKRAASPSGCVLSLGRIVRWGISPLDPRAGISAAIALSIRAMCRCAYCFRSILITLTRSGLADCDDLARAAQSQVYGPVNLASRV